MRDIEFNNYDSFSPMALLPSAVAPFLGICLASAEIIKMTSTTHPCSYPFRSDNEVDAGTLL
jgi:hypothetical protein